MSNLMQVNASQPPAQPSRLVPCVERVNEKTLANAYLACLDGTWSVTNA